MIFKYLIKIIWTIHKCSNDISKLFIQTIPYKIFIEFTFG